MPMPAWKRYPSVVWSRYAVRPRMPTPAAMASRHDHGVGGRMASIGGGASAEVMGTVVPGMGAIMRILN